jgi:hypothetical protein
MKSDTAQYSTEPPLHEYYGNKPIRPILEPGQSLNVFRSGNLVNIE